MSSTRSNQITSIGSVRQALARRWTLPLMGSVAVLVVGVVCLREVNSSAVKNLEAQLTTILEADVKALTIWIDEQKQNAAYIARRDDLRQAVDALVRLNKEQATNQQLLDANEQADIAELIEAATEIYGYVDYAVVDRTGRILADGINRYVGQQMPPTWEKHLPRVLSGKPSLAKPYREVILSRDAAGKLHENLTLMAVAAPIHDSDGQVIAVIGFGILPEKEFTDILSVARAAASGETYAFSEDGWMLSGSRFNDQLAKIGLLPSEPGASAVLHVRLGDPGVDLTKGGILTKPISVLPLTEMVTATLAAREAGDFGINVNTTGYNDYRGVKVVGAYTWLPEYDFGVATEIDYNEAYAPRILLRNVVTILFGLTVASLAAIVMYTRVLGRIQQRMRRAEREIRKLGQYTLIEKIGEGGMGEVFRASHAMLRRPTAVKLLRPDRNTEMAITRFEREVQLTAQLTHPNTIAIYDYGRTPEGVF